MKLLKHIEDKSMKQDSIYKVREASRAIIIDKNRFIPILHSKRFNYHKLPGGGIENGESNLDALARELKEETGCKAEITSEVGKITEYRSKFNLFQTSYCYFGKVLEKGNARFTKEEQINEFELIWVSIQKAIELVKNDRTDDYEGKFIRERDLSFLEEVGRLTSEAS